MRVSFLPNAARVAVVLLLFCGDLFSQVPDTLDQRRHTFFKSPVNNQGLPGAIRIYEPASESGNNWIGIRAPYALTQNQQLILPVAPPTVGQVLSAVTADSLKWVNQTGGSGSAIVTRLGGTIISSIPTDFDFSASHFVLSDANKDDSVEVSLAAIVSLLGQTIATGEIEDGTITEDDVNANIAGSGIVLTPGSPGTLDFAPSELTNIIFSNGGAATGSIAFDLTSGDPAITFGNGFVNVSSGTLQQGGTAVVLESRTIGTTSPLAGGGALSDDLTLSISNDGINATHIDETAQYNFSHVSNQFRGLLFHADTLRFSDNGGVKAADDTLYFFTSGGDLSFRIDLSDVPATGEVLKISAGKVASWQEDGGGAGGEANTASNLGGGLANFDSKSGVDLRFNTFAAVDFDLASNLITIDDTKWAKDSELHAAVTLAADSDVLLGLSTQQLTLDAQNANVVFAGPASGGAVDPTFRALVDDDIPDNITITNLSGTNTGDVTLSGTPDYLTIAGQVITRGLIDLAADVTGTLPDGNVSDNLTLATVSGAIDAGAATSFEIPNGASVTTDAFGEIAADNNAWATGRGAIQFFDGTANTNLVGVLVSDAPNDGDVPKFNTASGTITWEADAGAGGGAPVSATYIVASLDGTLTSERRLQGTAGEVALADGGANGDMVISLPTLLTLSAKELQGGTLFLAEGATANDFEGTFNVADFTADRTITFPDLDGTVTLLGNTTTGTGNLVLATSPTIVTPTIASFANAVHDHEDAAGGGQLDHGLALTGLTDDDHTNYHLVAGRAGDSFIVLPADPSDGAHADAPTLTLRAKYNPTGATGVTNKNLTLIHNVTNSETGASQLDFNFGAGVIATLLEGSIGTIVGTSGTQTLTSKTIDGNNNTLTVIAGQYASASIDGDDINSNIAGSGLVLTAGTPDALDFAPSELTNITFSNGGGATGSITFNLNGTTDPVIAFGDGVVNVSAGSLQEGGANVFTTADGALADDNLGDNSIDDLSDVTITSAAATHILVRNSGNTAWENVAVSGDGSISATGALTVNDDSHAHTTTTISGIDISDDTNLIAGTNITLTGDQLDVDDVFMLNSGDIITGNLTFSDGVGDSPQSLFTPQTGTIWAFYVEDTGDDLQIEVNTGATETFDIVNAGAGVINVTIDGTLTASNVSGTNTGDDDVDDEAIHNNVSGEIAAITAKATPTISDFLLIEDAAASNAKKSITLGAMEAALEGVLDLDELQGNLTGTKVNFADTDGNWTATNVQAALEELDDVINGGVPNSATAKVDWSQLANVPAGFADGTDDGGGGGSWSDLTAPTAAVSMVSDGTSETVTFDFQAAFTTGNQFTIKQTTGNPSGGSLVAVQAADANVSPIMLLENTAAVTIPIALNIIATNASGVITTAIDVSDGEIVTALALGSNDVTVGGATISSAEFEALDDGIALTTETSGNYVASVATTSPLAGGAAGSEGATLTLSITADGINATHIDETVAYAWSGASTVTGSMQFDGDALRILDAGADHYLTITPGTNLSANRVLTITTGDAARNLTFAGDATISGTNSGDQTITLTGNVTGSGTGTFATTIAEDVVTAAMMANGDHGAFTYTTNVAALDAGSVSGGSGGVITDGSITADDLGTNSVGADELQADALLWNEIGDAGADATIALGANETDFTSTIDAAGEAVITITNTDADAANDNSFIDLRHNDGADANVFYLRMVGDNDGSPVTDYSLSQTAFLVGAGVTTTFSGSVSASALTEGANAVPNATDHLGFFAATTSAQLAGVLSDEEGSGGGFVRATSPTITTPTISGAIVFPDGVRQTFNPDGTNAGINVGSQAGDPSTPSNGDLWYDSSANELTARINGTNVALGAGGSSDIVRSWTLENPTGAENFGAITFPFAVTVQEVRAVLVGSATPSVTINFSHGSDRSGTGATNLFSSGQAITSTTTGSTLSTFNDATVAADEWFWLTTSAQSGTVSEIVVSVHFTVD